MELLRLVQVVDKTDANDRFDGLWKSFDPVRTDQRIATRADGVPVLAPRDGYIVFLTRRRGLSRNASTSLRRS